MLGWLAASACSGDQNPVSYCCFAWGIHKLFTMVSSTSYIVDPCWYSLNLSQISHNSIGIYSRDWQYIAAIWQSHEWWQEVQLALKKENETKLNLTVRQQKATDFFCRFNFLSPKLTVGGSFEFFFSPTSDNSNIQTTDVRNKLSSDTAKHNRPVGTLRLPMDS